jgi:hypothetical protein
VKIFTSHLKPGAAPVVVREGFSAPAAIFGFLWLLWHRAWIAAALLFATFVIVAKLGDLMQSPALPLGLIVLQGMFGRDLVRWNLARVGYRPGPVVLAANDDSALARLVTERADLFPNLAETLA